MNAVGDFVVAWQSGLYVGNGAGTDGDEYGIRARRFNAAGNPLDAQDFLVNNTTDKSQEDPTVAMDDAGNFVIVWDSVLPTFNRAIVARRFNIAGQPQGNEFSVASLRRNSGTSNAAPVPVAMGSDGSLRWVWDATNERANPRRYSSGGVALDVILRIVVAEGSGNGRRVDEASVAKDGAGNIIVSRYETIKVFPRDDGYLRSALLAIGRALESASASMILRQVNKGLPMSPPIR